MNDHNKININEYIKVNAGDQCLRLCKDYENEVIQIKKAKEQLFFNEKCLANDVAPRWTLCKSRINTPIGHQIAKKFSFDNLKLQIKLDKFKIARLNSSINCKYKIICKKLPLYIVQLLEKRIERKSNYISSKHRYVQNVKFKKLTQIYSNRIVGSSYDLNNDNNNEENNININNEWTINLSSGIFDKYEISIFNLDPKYQVTPNTIKNEQIIANIECKLSYLITDQTDLARTRVSLVYSYSKIKPNLSVEQFRAIKRIKSYQDIYVTQADKGNKTVILNYQDYLNKVNEILQDTNCYETVNTDKSKSVASKLIEFLKTYHKNGYIEYNQYLKIYPDNFCLPDIYALIKIHKLNYPARLICPYYCHPLSSLSSYINDIITPSIRNSIFSIKNKFKFVEEVKNLRISRNDIMVSLDIVNLFTNIPLDFTLNIVHDKLCSDDSLSERCKLPITEIMNLINFIMNNNYFTFNKKFYKQISGAPMGCNLSPILAEALVSTIFELSLVNNHQVKYCRFYVDDSFLIINKRYVDAYLNLINSIGQSYRSIKFTIEKEENNMLAFLDIKLTRLND